ncbi:MAG: DUF4363 family protein [Firmicutes bacterium]|nr:DUF4363 family protein [Bacillota bacterium]
MKSLILPLIIFIIMLLAWGGFSMYTQDSSEVLVSSMENVYIYAKSGDWQQAGKYNDVFINDWNKYEKIYALYMESTSLHDVKLSAERCRGYIESQDQTMTMGESASILSHIKLLQKTDTMEIGNLF